MRQKNNRPTPRYSPHPYPSLGPGASGRWVVFFDATSAWAFVRTNADKIRGHVAIRLGLGDKNQHLSRNHHMKAVLDELHIPFQYTELPGVGHNAKQVYQMIGLAGWQAHFKQMK